MTVQELINELEKIKDKTQIVYLEEDVWVEREVLAVCKCECEDGILLGQWSRGEDNE